MQKVYEPYIQALIGTASQLCEAVLLQSKFDLLSVGGLDQVREGRLFNVQGAVLVLVVRQ